MHIKTLKKAVLDGFDVPGGVGCKSILNVEILHKSHIAELFGLMNLEIRIILCRP